MSKLIDTQVGYEFKDRNLKSLNQPILNRLPATHKIIRICIAN